MVYIYDACDHNEFKRFINFSDCLVQCHCTLKKDIEFLCSFISSILSFDTKVKKRDLVFFKYLDVVFGVDCVVNCGQST
jgi:hypothetical protein